MAVLLNPAPGRPFRLVSHASLVLIGLASTGWARQEPAPPEVQVLTRGPIHEAYAAPVVANPTPGPVVSRPPPATRIDEVPPDRKPEGDEVAWLPGAWAWDEARADHVWVGGLWRVIPLGRQWVPGYWGPVDGGFSWVSGFWAAASANGQFTYMPTPPASLEAGPITPRPGPDFSWIPGSWAWARDRYAWRSGEWVQASPDWVWTPSRYVPTPSGFLYVEGFWDRDLARRGVAFAPVAFRASALARPSFAYAPTDVLTVAGLLSSLFVRPDLGQYAFGAARPGFVPWFAFQDARLGYDPLYGSMAALNAGRPEWDRRLRDEDRDRREASPARPVDPGWIQPFRTWSESPEASPLHFVAVPEAARGEQARRIADFRAVARDRARMESFARPHPDIRPEDRPPLRLELPGPPLSAATGPLDPGVGRVAPPPDPEAHRATRPVFEHEPALIRPFSEPHAEPGPRRPRPGHQPHDEPRPAPVEHPKPVRPR